MQSHGGGPKFCLTFSLTQEVHRPQPTHPGYSLHWEQIVDSDDGAFHLVRWVCSGVGRLRKAIWVDGSEGPRSRSLSRSEYVLALHQVASRQLVLQSSDTGS